jgi:hypothetical protein
MEIAMPAREELNSFMDLYLGALAKGEPSLLPAAPDLKYTENCQQLRPGQGIWKTVGDKVGGQYLADTVAGQVAFFGVVTELERAALIATRLRVNDGRISEIENFVVRQGSIIFSPETSNAARPHFEETLEPAERIGREQLARIPHLYLDAITADDGSKLPVRDDCIRVENGIQTTCNPDAQLDAAKMGVREQIDKGYTRHIAGGVERRIWVLDEERGISVAFFFFDHPGNLESVNGRVPFGYPNYMPAAEIFKTRNGQIERIEAIIDIYQYGIKSGW